MKYIEFDEFHTPGIIKGIWVSCLMLCAMAAVFIILSGGGQFPLQTIMSVIGCGGVAIFLRVLCELIILMFKIHDELRFANLNVRCRQELTNRD